MLRDPHECFAMTATTFFGLEDTLARELEELGAKDVIPVRRAVSFSGDKALLYRANYQVRCALRILVPLFSFEASSTDELYEKALAYPWHNIMPLDGRFFIDTAVFSTIFTNSRFALYRLKDAIRDYDVASEFPRNLQAIDTRRTDVCLHLHISEKQVTISMDSSGESLHHRGYRSGYTQAPLNEVLAAGILKMTGYDGTSAFMDPMCGSGTLLIEAAMIASNTPAGFYRDDFAFRHWLDFDFDLWSNIKREPKRKHVEMPIIGRDRDFKAIGITTANVTKAGFRQVITIDKEDFLDGPVPAEEPLMIIMNPPYGKRIMHEDIQGLYQGIGSTLKHRYAGVEAWVLASPPYLFESVGLAHTTRVKLFNGELICELRKFEIFEGKRKEYVERTKLNEEQEPAPIEEASTTLHPECPQDEKSQEKEIPKRTRHRVDKKKTPRSERPRRSRSEIERLSKENDELARRVADSSDEEVGPVERRPFQKIQVFGSDRRRKR